MRCGAHVCGVLPGELLEWDESGALVRSVPAPHGSTFVSATGDDDGLYLVVADAAGQHLVQLP